MRYTVKRMDPAKKLLLHWKDQEHWYWPVTDEVMFAKNRYLKRKPNDRTSQGSS